MRMGFFGDLHGRYDTFYNMVYHLVEHQEISIAFQVGDFGFSEKILKSEKLFNLPIPLYIIDGNHEDFRFLWKALQQGEFKKWATHSLNYQPRGTAITIGGICAGFIGGALHVDQPQKRKAGNVITNDDVNKALKEFSENPPDIILSHSCPAGIGIGMKGKPSHAWGVANHIIMAGYDPGPSYDYGETQLTSLWERMPIKPKLWIYGHFHEYHLKKIGDTQFICLPRIDLNQQCVIWDTDSGKIEFKSLYHGI